MNVKIIPFPTTYKGDESRNNAVKSAIAYATNRLIDLGDREGINGLRRLLIGVYQIDLPRTAVNQ